MNAREPLKGASTLAATCPVCGESFLLEDFCPRDGVKLKQAESDPMIGSYFAERFQIISKLGAGGMGSVYKAKHLLMDKVIALKVLEKVDGESARRFQMEAKLACQLQHPNIINVSDFGISAEGQPYLVMDYLEGQSLGDVVLKEKTVKFKRALRIFLQACDALNYAHKRRLIHRDLKPGNLMLINDESGAEVVKLVDFGIAKQTQDETNSLALTRTGEVFGSPMYMSPEQCLGQKLDSRSDIYSLGCVMYEVVTGQTPFQATGLLEILNKHTTEDPLPFHQTNPHLQLVPAEFEKIVFTAMRRDLDKRYQTVLELWSDLQALESQLTNTAGSLSVNQSATTAQPGGDNGHSANVQPARSDGQSAHVQPARPSIQPGRDEAPSPYSQSRTVPLTKKALAGGTAPPNSAIKPKSAMKPQQSNKMPIVLGSVVLIILGAAALFMVSTASHNSTSKTQITGTSKATKTPEDQAAPRWLRMKQEGDKEFKDGHINSSLALLKKAGAAAAANSVVENDPELIGLYKSLGRAYYEEDRNKEAEQTLHKALSICDKDDKLSGSAEAAEIKTILGSVLSSEGRFEEANRLFDRALAIGSANNGDDNTLSSNTLLARAGMHIKLKHSSEALADLNEALALRRASFSPGDEDSLKTNNKVSRKNEQEAIARIENEIGRAYEIKGVLDQAKDAYSLGQQYAEKSVGTEHPLYADSLFGLASINFMRKHFEEASSQYKKAQVIRELSFGISNLRTAQVVACLGILKTAQGQYDDGIALLDEALRVRTELLGADNPEVKNFTKTCDEIKRSRGTDNVRTIFGAPGRHAHSS
jgi:eukaryotic-like serine/threonine-protein kinase